jgi:hypothetical protein
MRGHSDTGDGFRCVRLASTRPTSHPDGSTHTAMAASPWRSATRSPEVEPADRETWEGREAVDTDPDSGRSEQAPRR